MFWRDEVVLLLGGGDECASCQVVGSSEESSGALLYGGDGWFGEEVLLYARDLEVVQEIGLHVLEGDAGQMASGHDPGGQG